MSVIIQPETIKDILKILCQNEKLRVKLEKAEETRREISFL